MPTRINVSLDDARAAKLRRLAERTDLADGTLARSLLSSAIDEAEPDAETVTAILDGTPGLYERVQASIAQADAGELIPIDEI